MPTLMSTPHSARRAANLRPCLVSAFPHSEDLTAQCGALGLDLFDTARIPQPPSVPVLLEEGSAEAVSMGLAPPYCGFVELGVEGIVGVGLRCLETVRAGGLTLSLQTSTIYRLEALELLARAIRSRFSFLPPDTVDLMEISLAEAISNAVIHGNLGIPNHLRTTTAGFVQFQKIMHERLNDPSLACRRVEINIAALGQDTLCVAVSDQGNGFDLYEKLDRSVHATAKNGRGLCLIHKAAQSLRGEDGGRTLVMTFT